MNFKIQVREVVSDASAQYHRWRTHLSLGMDSPEPRAVQPPRLGKVVEFPKVGGLHHRYERLAA
jgi:putative transposase